MNHMIIAEKIRVISDVKSKKSVFGVLFWVFLPSSWYLASGSWQPC